MYYFCCIFHNLKRHISIQYRKMTKTPALPPWKKQQTNPILSEWMNQKKKKKRCVFLHHAGLKTFRELVAQDLTLAESKKSTSGAFSALLKSPVTMFCRRLLAVLGEQLRRPCQHIPPLGATFPKLPTAECDTLSTIPLSAALQISAPGLPRGQSCWTCWRRRSSAGWWRGLIDLCVTCS